MCGARSCFTCCPCSAGVPRRLLLFPRRRDPPRNSTKSFPPWLPDLLVLGAAAAENRRPPRWLDGFKIVIAPSAGKRGFMGFSTHFAPTIGGISTDESEKLLLHRVPTGLSDLGMVGGKVGIKVT